MTNPTWNPMRQAFDPAPSLADFLLARADDDDRAAESALAASSTLWPHAALGRALQDRAAMVRRIMELHEITTVIASTARRKDDTLFGCAVCDWDDRCGEVGGRHYEPLPCDTLKALALPYVSHPAFREEWRA